MIMEVIKVEWVIAIASLAFGVGAILGMKVIELVVKKMFKDTKGKYYDSSKS